MLAADAALAALSLFLAYFVRFDGAIPAGQAAQLWQTVVWVVPVKIGCFYLFGLYRGMWRYTGLHDLLSLIKACAVSSVLVVLTILLAHGFTGFSRGVFLIDLVLTLVLVGGARLCIRIAYAGGVRAVGNGLFRKAPAGVKNLVIIGAGDAGEKLLREIAGNPGLGYCVVGFVDDDVKKVRHTLHGVPVLGRVADLARIAGERHVEEAIIAVPSAGRSQIRKMVEACSAAQVPCKTLPGLSELIQGKVSVSHIRQVKYEDLLSREAVDLDLTAICGYLTGKRVMVTGGAGSIGSELCRQIAGYAPEKLVLVERNESGLYDFALDLKRDFPELCVEPALAAVQNRERMENLFAEHRPQVIFHAAAYKHVPMMEVHPWEAVFNNVVGSAMVLELCGRFNVERCVVVSTDKAVRPTNVMGATKRLTEMLMQAYAKKNGVRFMAVRFGNVLGSAGSVFPLFKKQIESGGPVTLTHPDVTRYFMTIPEASSLILQAGAMGQGGEIFVLKMGTPVRIADMAADMIRLSGFEPGKDIEIAYVGLRPGEKLYEELITQGEDVVATSHPDIMVMKNGACLPVGAVLEHVGCLVALAKAGDGQKIRGKLSEVVPEYTPQEVFAAAQAEKSALDAAAVRARAALEQKARSLISEGAAAQAVKLGEEDRLLLQCLREGEEPAGPFGLVSLSSSEWGRVLAQAVRHRVAPLLFRRIEREGIAGLVPADVYERLKKICIHYTQVNMWLFHELGTALRRLKEEGIDAMALKGAHLAEAVYGDIGMRPMGDMDLLVRQEDLGRAQEVLGALGYDSQEKRMLMDVHWYLVHEVPVDMEGVWGRSREAVIGGVRARVLCPEDLVLHLCSHVAFHHQFQIGGLRTLCDLREVVLRYGEAIDWQAVLERAGQWGVPNAVSFTLMMARQMLGVPVPEAAVGAILGDAFTAEAKKWALERMFGNGFKDMPVLAVLLADAGRGFHGEKLSSLRQVLFPPREFVSQKYPAAMGSLGVYWYYAVRFCQKAGLYGGVWLRVLMKDARMLAMLEEKRRDTAVKRWMGGKGRGQVSGVRGQEEQRAEGRG